MMESISSAFNKVLSNPPEQSKLACSTDYIAEGYQNFTAVNVFKGDNTDHCMDPYMAVYLLCMAYLYRPGDGDDPSVSGRLSGKIVVVAKLTQFISSFLFM